MDPMGEIEETRSVLRIPAILPFADFGATVPGDEILRHEAFKRRVVRGGVSAVLGDCFDEELIIIPGGVIWNAAGYRRLQVITGQPVLCARWGRLHDDDQADTLCILMRGCMTLHSLSGSKQVVPLPQEYSDVHPLPQGILLTGSRTDAPSFLNHPLEPPLELGQGEVGGCFPNLSTESIIWSDTEVPILVTHNSSEERIKFWKVQPRKNSSATGVGTSLTTKPAKLADVGQTGPIGTPSSQARLMRLPDGSLSPLAFQATPNKRCQIIHSLCPKQDPPFALELAYEMRAPTSAMPMEGHLVHDSNGESILGLLSKSTGLLIGIAMDKALTPLGLAFKFDEIESVAAVVATRGCSSQQLCDTKSLPHGLRDLLVLRRDGLLRLYTGQPNLLEVQVEFQADDNGAPYASFFSETPHAISTSGSAASTVRALQYSAKWSVPTDDSNPVKDQAVPFDLWHAAGSRVTLVEPDCTATRVSMSIAPLSCIIREAVGALSKSKLISSTTKALMVSGRLTSDSNLKTEVEMLRNALAAREVSPAVPHRNTAPWELLKHTSYSRSSGRFGESFTWTSVSPEDDWARNNMTNLTTNQMLEVNKALLKVCGNAKLNLLNEPLLVHLHDICSTSDKHSSDPADVHARLVEILTSEVDSADIDAAVDDRASVVARCFIIIRDTLLAAIAKHDDEPHVADVFEAGKNALLAELQRSGWDMAQLDSAPASVADPIRRFLGAGYGELPADMPQPYLRNVFMRTQPRVSDDYATISHHNIMVKVSTDALLRFGEDLRLAEAYYLLASSHPAVLLGTEVLDEGAERSQQQQAAIATLATRTMALPFGRGALEFCTYRCLPTEPLSIPALSLSAKIAERNNAVVSMDLGNAAPPTSGGAASDLTAWPEFHNGVAAGLRLAPGGRLSRTWIAYNNPSEPSYQHAGMLLGLGLTGQLSCLAATDLYRYLSQEHDPTVIAILLGMSATKRGSMDPAVSKMLFLHVPTRHPAGYPELEIAPLVQTAALVGLGFLYQGSKHRGITEILLQEIGRRPGGSYSGNGQNPWDSLSHGVTRDCEAYALGAGMALGLVNLAQGRNAFGPLDCSVESQLRYFMIGGIDSGTIATRSGLKSCAHSQPAASTATGFGGLAGLHTVDSTHPPNRDGSASRPAGAVAEELLAAQGAARVILEGDLINLNVTSPAATIALGLQYLQTNDASAAKLFRIPETEYELAFVYPSHLALRVLMRCLVMWDSIEPTCDWVSEQLPNLLQHPLAEMLARIGDASDDLQSVAQAQCSILTGACLALGIRFAGSGDKTAATTLQRFVVHFLHLKTKLPAEQGIIDKVFLEECLGATCVSLGALMAGTGDLPTFKLLRSLRKRVAPPTAAGHIPSSPTFGSSAAIAMAIGFLFFGGGAFSFKRDSASVAALVISLWPRLPMNSSDNRHHLQALRHFWALAACPLPGRDFSSNDQISQHVDIADDLLDGDLSTLLGRITRCSESDAGGDKAFRDLYASISVQST